MGGVKGVLGKVDLLSTTLTFPLYFRKNTLDQIDKVTFGSQIMLHFSSLPKLPEAPHLNPQDKCQ